MINEIMDAQRKREAEAARVEAERVERERFQFFGPPTELSLKTHI